MDPGSGGGSGGTETFAQHQARVAREQATALRHQAADMRHKVRSGAMSARKAAREQITEARARAAEIRRRARGRRGRSVNNRAIAERQPSFTLMAIGFCAVLLIGAFVAIAVLTEGRSHSKRVQVSIPDLSDSISLSVSVPSDGSGRPLLLVPRVSEPDDPVVAARLAKIVEQHRRDGYNVVVNSQLVKNGVTDLLNFVTTKFDQLVALLAVEMIVLWVAVVVLINGTAVEVHFSQKAGLDQLP